MSKKSVRTFNSKLIGNHTYAHMCSRSHITDKLWNICCHLIFAMVWSTIMETEIEWFYRELCTADHENFSVKKKQNLHAMTMNKCARKSTPAEVNVQSRTIYIKRYLALLIPGSRLNARNSLGTHPHCNHQPLKKISTDRTELWKFSRKLFLTWKFPDSRYMYSWLNSTYSGAPLFKTSEMWILF